MAIAPGLPFLWFGEVVNPVMMFSQCGYSCTPPLPHSFRTPAEVPPSPAELPRVIHVRPRLDVAFFWVVDGGGSGISSSQDEHKAIEGDSRCIFVVCENGRAGGQGLWKDAPSSFFPSSVSNSSVSLITQRTDGGTGAARPLTGLPFSPYPHPHHTWALGLPTART